MNNKPVAWLWTKDGKPQTASLSEPITAQSFPHWADKGFKVVPLYTHPVKELTKELDALLCSVLGEAYLGEEKEQALAKEIRAILRKAQEK